MTKVKQNTFWSNIIILFGKLWYNFGYIVLVLLVFVYPFLWGFYFSFVRYLRFGSTLDLSAYFSNLVSSYLDFILLSIFVFYYLFFWLCVILYIIRCIRLELWDHFTSFFYPFHLRFLQYTFYFSFFRFLHKVNYLLRLFSMGVLGNDYTQTRYNHFFVFLYRYPFVLTIIFLISLGVELMITHGLLYYGVYTLFYYPMIMAILRCLNSDIFYDFVSTVNESDFYHANWMKVHYPHKFWTTFPMDKLPANISENNRLQLEAMRHDMIEYCYSNKGPLHNRFDLLMRCHGLTIEYTFNATGRPIYPYSNWVHTRNRKPFCILLKADYYYTTDVRWFHSSRILYYPITPLSPAAIRAFTPKEYMEVLALVNFPGVNFTHIQQLAKTVTWPSPASIHEPHRNILLDNEPRRFINVMECNQVSSFRTLGDNGVTVGTFVQMKSRVPYATIMSMQECPDVVLQFKNSAYPSDVTYGIDHKTRDVTNFGRNQIVTPVGGTIQEYETLLKAYQIKYTTKFGVNPKVNDVLKQLLQNADNSERHQQLWASNAHLFPPRWQPPLYADRAFKHEFLTTVNRELFLEAERRIRSMSEPYIPSTSIVD